MYTVAVCGSRSQLREALAALGLTGRIMTAYVERVNLTLREHVPPLSRRTWSLARNEHALRIHLEWGRAYYHFCRYHEGFACQLRYRTAIAPEPRPWRPVSPDDVGPSGTFS